MTARRPHALIVDDEPMVRWTARDIIEEAGFVPLEASSAAQALAILDRCGAEVDLLFTDVQMPGGMNGFGLAGETSRRYPHIAILVASGVRRPEPGEMPDGAVFVHKPFSVEVIEARLKELFPEGRSRS